MKPKVTVLTTVYNGLPYLKEAIESTLNQTYTNFDYLIIDDRSTDDSVKCILSYDDPRIKLVQNEKNLGTSDNINLGLSMIDTEYVVRLDQDDVSLPTRIEDQINYLEQHPDISIVCSWEHAIDSEGNKIRDWKSTINNYGDFLGHVLLGLCPIWHPSIAFRTEAMIEAGGFNIEYTRAEDFEVTTRLAVKRYGAAVVPKFHLLQRKHTSSQSAEFNSEQASVSRRVHNETISHFSSSPHNERLGYFLRVEKNPNEKKFDKESFKKVSSAFNELIDGATKKQNLSIDELESLKKIIYKRAGYAIGYATLLSSLPSILFYPIFYLLSPLQMQGFRKRLSSLFHGIMKSRYFFK